MVKAFPGRRTDWDVADQADGFVVKGLLDAQRLAVLIGFTLVGTVLRRIGDVFQVHGWCCLVQTSLCAKPLVTLSVCIKAIRGESVSIGANGTPFVIVTPRGPLCFVFVGGMCAQVNHPLGTTLIDGVQKRVIAEPCISGNDI